VCVGRFKRRQRHLNAPARSVHTGADGPSVSSHQRKSSVALTLPVIWRDILQRKFAENVGIYQKTKAGPI